MVAMHVYRALGARVAQLRRGLGLTQVEFAERAGLSRASIASIEAGRQRITLDQLYEIARGLGIGSLAELVPMDVPSSGTSTPIASARPISAIQSAQIDGIVRGALARGRR